MAEVADVDECAGRALRLAPPSRQGLLRLLFSGGAQCNHQLHAVWWTTRAAGAGRATRRCRTSGTSASTRR
eukprot:15448782-Alexandrium_andersonii.AAC.1